MDLQHSDHFYNFTHDIDDPYTETIFNEPNQAAYEMGFTPRIVNHERLPVGKPYRVPVMVSPNTDYLIVIICDAVNSRVALRCHNDNGMIHQNSDMNNVVIGALSQFSEITRLYYEIEIESSDTNDNDIEFVFYSRRTLNVVC